ncbi:MAG: hypothetical protein AAF501_17945 [Pseudomonadota bacterium]
MARSLAESVKAKQVDALELALQLTGLVTEIEREQRQNHVQCDRTDQALEFLKCAHVELFEAYAATDALASDFLDAIAEREK